MPLMMFDHLSPTARSVNAHWVGLFVAINIEMIKTVGMMFTLCSSCNELSVRCWDKQWIITSLRDQGMLVTGCCSYKPRKQKGDAPTLNFSSVCARPHLSVSGLWNMVRFCMYQSDVGYMQMSCLTLVSVISILNLLTCVGKDGPESLHIPGHTHFDFAEKKPDRVWVVPAGHLLQLSATEPQLWVGVMRRDILAGMETHFERVTDVLINAKK